MIEASYLWKEAYKQPLVPETFVEITIDMSDGDARKKATVSGKNEAFFSDASYMLVSGSYTPKCATLEPNLWVLDGTRNLLANSTSRDAPGYASANNSGASVTLSLPAVSNVTIPGFTITWSSEYEEYPTDFTVEVKRKGTTIANIPVIGNNSTITKIEREISGYDEVVVTVTAWNTPNHRVRIDNFRFGFLEVFGKRDLLSYVHEESGDLLSAELPKTSITFSLDNTSGRWNPSNATGVGRYLSERQMITVRYGTDINGSKEWINGGTFFLSEWNAPSNGLEAQFVARDVFEFIVNTDPAGFVGMKLGTMMQQVLLKEGFWGNNIEFNIDNSLNDVLWDVDGEHTLAENLQLMANQHRCIFWHDRNDDINIRPLDKRIKDYPLSLNLAYSHPEIKLLKPLKNIVFKVYANEEGWAETTEYNALVVNQIGETQIVDNPKLYSYGVSEDGKAKLLGIAEWVRDTLASRKTVTGEFRADPRLEIFDVVEVESKYGKITPVAITRIRYTYSGSFRGYYEGTVITI